jgi:hypothetical protein
MHLVADYVHAYKCGTGLPSQCRVRIYLPDEVEDAPVVLCSELATNLGLSVTEAVKRIAGEVIKHYRLPRPVWIEHYPPEATNGSTETFDLVVFESYEVRKVLTLSKRSWAARSSHKHPPPPWPVAIREALHAPCDRVPS